MAVDFRFKHSLIRLLLFRNGGSGGGSIYDKPFGTSAQVLMLDVVSFLSVMF